MYRPTTPACPAVLGEASARYLRRAALDLYAHYLNVNSGLPVFLREFYRMRVGQRAVDDAVLGVPGATPLAVYLTGMSGDELTNRASLGTLDLDDLVGEEVDDAGTTRLEEHADQFVDDLFHLLTADRMTFFVPEDDPEFDYELTFLANTGELALYDTRRHTPVNPYKGGGFSCIN